MVGINRNVVGSNMQVGVKKGTTASLTPEVKTTGLTEQGTTGLVKLKGTTTVEQVSSNFQVGNTTQTGNTTSNAPYRGGNWGKTVTRDLNNGRLHAGDHINVVSGGRMYRFQIVERANGSYTAVQVPFYNGANSVSY